MPFAVPTQVDHSWLANLGLGSRRCEQLPQTSYATRGAALHGARATAQKVGDLSLRLVLEIPEHQHRPLLRRQATKRVNQLRPLTQRCQTESQRSRRNRSSVASSKSWPTSSARRRERRSRPASARLTRIRRAYARGMSILCTRRQRNRDPKQALLNKVFCLGVIPCDQACRPQEPARVGADELVERCCRRTHLLHISRPLARRLTRQVSLSRDAASHAPCPSDRRQGGQAAALNAPNGWGASWPPVVKPLTGGELRGHQRVKDGHQRGEKAAADSEKPMAIDTLSAPSEVVPGLVELRGDGGSPAASAPVGSVRGGPAKIEGGTAVSSNVPVAQATMQEAVLPEGVQDALGELVGAAKEGCWR